MSESNSLNEGKEVLEKKNALTKNKEIQKDQSKQTHITKDPIKISLSNNLLIAENNSTKSPWVDGISIDSASTSSNSSDSSPSSTERRHNIDNISDPFNKTETIPLSTSDSSTTSSNRITGTKQSDTVPPNASKVLHISNLPLDLGEKKLRKLISKFGEIHKIDSPQEEKSQAFVEMKNLETAIRIIQHFQTNPLQILYA
ncbi:matrin 3/nuclear protein [Anaeramoeba flamelloides]|uniref:Matrin 3/nuclear protein n=1 Tax=Anaeramoeba flamelloides TaxID=1746091 RepID=A0ABQ8XEA6_9EUKA|nr:matrin 3/nuclear protein [Anaeramoeba flamelloides]